MDALITYFGLSCPVGYEYIFFVFKCCLAIFLIMELIGWLKTFTKSMLRGI